MIYKIIGLLILAVFYAVYISKMIIQRKQGIQTNQMAKGKKEKKVMRIESLLILATYSIVA